MQNNPDNEYIYVAPWYEVYQKLKASRGVEIQSEIRSRQVTSYTFVTNFQELQLLTQEHFKLRSDGKLGDFYNREPLHAFLFELTRRLQNFVFAAKALVDHTRNYVERLHKASPSVLQSYRRQVQASFGKSGIAAFTKGLRDFFAHCSTPFISSTIGGSEATGRDLYTLRLDIVEMQKSPDFDGWLPPAQKYIAKHGGEDVDLEIYIAEYYDAVTRFYLWFDQRNKEWCRRAWDESLAIQNELDEVLSRPNQRWKKIKRKAVEGE